MFRVGNLTEITQIIAFDGIFWESKDPFKANCDETVCMSECSRTHSVCLNGCPCHGDCANGCPCNNKYWKGFILLAITCGFKMDPKS